MGTKVQLKSCLPGHYSMRDLNEDSNSCSWPHYYEDKTLTNSQHYNGFFSRADVDVYLGYDKDTLKRIMLKHEAIFKNQVSELHRLYRIQRELMDEFKKKDLQNNKIPIKPSLSSSLLASQITTEEANKLHIPSFPVANSLYGLPSVSGVEDTYSPLSSVKGSSTRADPLSRNGGNIKDAEMLEGRPTKVRSKMFDLELPADEYIDTEEAEQFRDDTASGTSSYLLNGNWKIGPASGGKLFHAGKTDCLEDASRSNSCSRGKNSLADLNEPAQIEETDGSAFSHFLGHELSANPKQELPCLPKGISVNSLRESEKSVSNVHVEKNRTVRRFFCDMLEAGHSESNSKSISRGFHQQKLPVSSQQVTDQSKAVLSKERMLRGLEVPKRNGEISNNSHPESIAMSNVPSLNPFASSDVIKQWSHSVTSWDKPSCSLSEKSMTVPTHPFFNSPGPSSKSSVMSSPSIGIFGEKWQACSNSRLNPSFESEFPNQNGFYYDSSSGSKESVIRFPSVSYDSKGVSEHFPSHGSTKPYGCSTGVDMKSTSGVNLNAMLSNSESNEPVLQCGTRIDGGRNCEDHLRGLPWLRAMPYSKNEATSAGNDFSQNVTQDVKSVSFANNVDTSRSEVSEYLHNKKILGIPIFEKPFVSKNETSLTAPHASVARRAEVEAENKGRNRLLDINLPCDATLLDMNHDIVAENSVIEKETNKKTSSFRLQWDLNSCVDKDEASFISSVPSTGTKTTRGIDLEAPLIPEPEEVIHGEELLEKASEPSLQSTQSKDHYVQDERAKIAAEAIVAISSSCRDSNLDDVDCNSSENTMTDPLNWFVETISSFEEDLERKFKALTTGKDRDRDESSLEEIDYFESMVLNLAETREEDYMPEPLVPENFKVEETGTTSLLTTRARRGQRRRGRQRRDFQRDILPGLVSLSRYEVTEDLQTFGGLMRATGHSWNSTRAVCGRGRRRSVTSSSPPVADTTCMPLTQKLNNIEVGLEDRSLTGWGKTTRRPRRQRCPTGNPPSIALT
ncbi:uncharacterized protein LOC120216040 [Hibiscus syriacus]|uniref:uncharacterized protein LOC120216040 n=1 Tax=Hibiscus syriacus TaxID=106335 RepID=UPI0019216B7C|nr:uncharacterized protein LOC120216040 [Hibiscus syriacus]